MSRARRLYPKHSDDAFDRFITRESAGPDGEFSFARFIDLMHRLGCAHFIPTTGNNGTKRMTAGILLRREFADGVIEYTDGTRVILDLIGDSA